MRIDNHECAPISAPQEFRMEIGVGSRTDPAPSIALVPVLRGYLQ